MSKKTHTSSFASFFSDFFCFRFFTFSHDASTRLSLCSPPGCVITDSDTRGDVLCLFDGADEGEGEECLFMALLAQPRLGSSSLRRSVT
jgi:hypothetical protein